MFSLGEGIHAASPTRVSGRKGDATPLSTQEGTGASLTYFVLRVFPLGNEVGENAVNPRLAISPDTRSWSLPISSDDGEFA